MPETPPTLGDRLSDVLLVRRAEQTILALLLAAGLIALGVWRLRAGGGDGGLVDHDRLPEQAARFVVDVNRADLAELTALPGVGGTIAARILEHRRTTGPFHALDDLKKINGIGDKTLEQLRPHVTFGPSAAP